MNPMYDPIARSVHPALQLRRPLSLSLEEGIKGGRVEGQKKQPGHRYEASRDERDKKADHSYKNKEESDDRNKNSASGLRVLPQVLNYLPKVNHRKGEADRTSVSRATVRLRPGRPF